MNNQNLSLSNTNMQPLHLYHCLSKQIPLDIHALSHGKIELSAISHP